jgi:Rps23 Pro-64 3,4-dihydroxylase Tpa1-like proline 4-hydroxylase
MTETTLDDGPALNLALDSRALAEVYARRGRLHIPAFFGPQSALRVHRALAEETTYNLSVNSGAKVFDISPGDWAKLTSEQKKALVDSAAAGALRGFQLMYDTHRLSDDGEAYADQKSYLAKIVAFLEGEPFLSFVRQLTGEREIAFADAQATRYGPGHFLTAHNDDIAGKNRLAAYVINMTPYWRAEWGGVLLFLGKEGHVEEGYVPCFNALNIFKVPQVHLVSHVAPFANAKRHSITGWLRAR